MPNNKYSVKYKYKVKPTEKQRKAFMHLKDSKSIGEAMIKAGYKYKSSIAPGKNLLDRAGVKPLLRQYQEDLINAGVSTGMLANIQVEGLKDPNGAVRLGYLKETKKDFGISIPEDLIQTNVQVIFGREEVKDEESIR